MNQRRSTKMNAFVSIGVSVALGLALASLAARTPAVASFVPESIFTLLASVWRPKGQEEAANLEFLALWLFGFLVILFLVLAGTAALRRSRRT